MDEPTQPVVSSPVSPVGDADKKPSRLIIIGGIVVIILVALIAWGPQLLENIRLTGEFRDARFIGAGEKAGMYRFGWLGLSEVMYKDGVVTDYARVGEHEYAIVEDAGTGRVLVASLAKDGRTIASDAYRKSGLAVSPDGAWVAYAVFSGEGDTDALSSWSIQLASVATAEVLDLGAGYHPQFFTRDGKTQLFFVSPDGLTTMDPVAKTGFTTNFPTSASVSSGVSIAADGSYLVSQNRNTGTFTIFSIAAVEPFLKLTLGQSLPGTLTDARVRGATIYALEGSNVKKFDMNAPGEGTVVYTFKEGETYKLIP